MNLQEMNKEQKQVAFLGVMMVVVFVMLGKQLLLAPAQEGAEAAKTLIEEKGSEKENGERLLTKDALVQRNLQEDLLVMSEIRASRNLPPVSGKEFWAQKRLRTLAYRLGIDISASEHRSSKPRYLVLKGEPAEIAKRSQQLPFWIPYSIEVRGKLSFGQLNELLNTLQQDEPYASVAVLRITPSLDDETRHEVNLVVEWPIPRDESEWENILKELPEESS
jgi:hypothetical protein